MDVICSKCNAEYEFDKDRVPANGLAVKCQACGNVFRVFQPATSAPASKVSQAAKEEGFDATLPAPGAYSGWRLRTQSGKQFTCREVTTLMRWIVETRVVREDEISADGSEWKRLDSVETFVPFIQAAEDAALARRLKAKVKRQSGRFQGMGASSSHAEGGGEAIAVPEKSPAASVHGSHSGPVGPIPPTDESVSSKPLEPHASRPGAADHPPGLMRSTRATKALDAPSPSQLVTPDASLTPDAMESATPSDRSSDESRQPIQDFEILRHERARLPRTGIIVVILLLAAAAFAVFLYREPIGDALQQLTSNNAG